MCVILEKEVTKLGANAFIACANMEAMIVLNPKCNFPSHQITAQYHSLRAYPLELVGYSGSTASSYPGNFTFYFNYSFSASLCTCENLSLTATKKEPSCSSGNITITCSKCLKTVWSAYLAQIYYSHTYNSVVTAPTCDSEGYTTDTCTRCGAVTVRDTVSPLGHSYHAVTTPATCSKIGYTTYTCTRCNVSYASDITPMASHSYLYTANSDGHVITCKTCDYRLAEPHRFENNACICGISQTNGFDENLKFSMSVAVGAQMSVSFSISATAVSKYADFCLEVRKDNADGEPTVVNYGTSDGNEPMSNIADLFYSATFDGIAAKEMGQSISATLYALDENGNTHYGASVTTSVKDYLLSGCGAANATDEFKTMAVDMLKYGAAAQLRFGYDTENPVTDGLSEEQLAYATKDIPEAVDSYAASGAGATVNVIVTVGSKVELGLSALITGVKDPSAVRCEIRDTDGNLLASPDVAVSADIIFAVTYGDVGARDMRKPITATFFEGDSVVSQSIRWSVESYVAQTRARYGVTQAEVDIVNAMLTYGDSVAAYLTSVGQ